MIEVYSRSLRPFPVGDRLRSGEECKWLGLDEIGPLPREMFDGVKMFDIDGIAELHESYPERGPFCYRPPFPTVWAEWTGSLPDGSPYNRTGMLIREERAEARKIIPAEWNAVGAVSMLPVAAYGRMLIVFPGMWIAFGEDGRPVGQPTFSWMAPNDHEDLDLIQHGGLLVAQWGYFLTMYYAQKIRLGHVSMSRPAYRRLEKRHPGDFGPPPFRIHLCMAVPLPRREGDTSERCDTKVYVGKARHDVSAHYRLRPSTGKRDVYVRYHERGLLRLGEIVKQRRLKVRQRKRRKKHW